ncbi:MAG: hypothetical protein IPM50_00040 [Acidobacteriota bacterium]|nr:MAG: hypothetical protein IPM50_00040 [Acidobacteriota bacterium]
MKRRTTRPNVFRGLKRFGVYSTDWKYILVPTAIAYLIPFLLGIWIGYVPLGFPLGLFTFLVLLGTFNYLRLSKPEFWLSQKFDSMADGNAFFRAPLNSELKTSDWISDYKEQIAIKEK